MNDSIDLVLDDISRKFLLEEANKFSKTHKNVDEVFVGFIEAINASRECHFTHRVVYGDVLENVINKRSVELLEKLQTCYPSIFQEPKYPIIQNRVLFSIPLVDEKQPPPKHKLYPLREPKLKELRS